MMARRQCPTCGEGLRPAAMFVLNGRRIPLYPKAIPVQAADGHWFNFHEYRFYCGHCRVEWISSTQDRTFTEVDPTTVQQHFDPATGLLVEAR